MRIGARTLVVGLLVCSVLVGCGGDEGLDEWCAQFEVAVLAYQGLTELSPDDPGYDQVLTVAEREATRLLELEAPREIRDIFPVNPPSPFQQDFPISEQAAADLERQTSFVLDNCDLDPDLARTMRDG